ncbi:MAG: triphosphoribosyl-dephospho-CoA synthase [Planctomycetaceae bacterium]
MVQHIDEHDVSPSWTSFLETNVLRACVLEAAARKPGNVHPSASFPDTTYADFVRSAVIVAPLLARTHTRGIGETIFNAVRETRQTLGSNTNLGIVLLLAPLCAVPAPQSLAEGIHSILRGLTRDDAVWVYRAIRLAQPGGLGEASTGDVHNEPPGTLFEMMQLAASRDSIAREYAEGYPLILEVTRTHWRESAPFTEHWEASIIELQLKIMAAHPDSLIGRKCGQETAELASTKARQVLQAGGSRTDEGRTLLTEFDRWLREDGNRRNPGTTADLIAGALFAAARERVLELPDLVTIERDIQRRSSHA